MPKKSFLIIFSEKQTHLFSDALLAKHLNYLKKLKAVGVLSICGPFSDNTGAMLVIHAESHADAEALIQNDPFIQENYYNKFLVQEFSEANEDNHWLGGSTEGQKST